MRRTVLAVGAVVALVAFTAAAATASTAPPSTAVAECEPPTSTIAGASTSSSSAAATTSTVAPTTLTVPDDWFPFVSPAGDFTVSFPGEPESSTQDLTLPDGSVVPFEIYSYDEGEVGWLASRVTYAPGTEVSLEGARDGSVANVGGTLVSSTPIELQCHPGIEFIAAISSGDEEGTGVSRLYAVDNVLYQLIVVGPGDFGAGEPGVASFFVSFTFTGDAAA